MLRIDFGRKFERQADRLSNKYPHLDADLQTLSASLQTNPQQGSPLGKNCYKVRMAFSDKGAGKSGGGRVITYVKLRDDLIVLLAIYDKSEEATLSKESIQRLLKEEGLQ